MGNTPQVKSPNDLYSLDVDQLRSFITAYPRLHAAFPNRITSEWETKAKAFLERKEAEQAFKDKFGLLSFTLTYPSQHIAWYKGGWIDDKGVTHGPRSNFMPSTNVTIPSADNPTGRIPQAPKSDNPTTLEILTGQVSDTYWGTTIPGYTPVTQVLDKVVDPDIVNHEYTGSGLSSTLDMAGQGLGIGAAGTVQVAGEVIEAGANTLANALGINLPLLAIIGGAVAAYVVLK